MIFAPAGKSARRHTLPSSLLPRMQYARNGSQNAHATKYRSRFCVHASRCPVRYSMNIGPNDQRASAPIQAAVAVTSSFLMFECSLTSIC